MQLFRKLKNTLLKLRKFSQNGAYRHKVLTKKQIRRKIRHLHSLPRYIPGKIKLLKHEIQYDDSFSLAVTLEEIFIKENYRLPESMYNPRFIDCGCNIGISIFYLKTRFPDARIIGFEPDPHIFSILQKNLASFEFKDVVIFNQAIWTDSRLLDFDATGGVSGHLSSNPSVNSINVQAISLESHLHEKVDFLKMDIEGAESIVIPNLGNALNNIERVFIEYHSESSKKQELDRILQALTANGFRYQIREVFTCQHPFIEGDLIRQNRFFDLQLEIFAYRTS